VSQTPFDAFNQLDAEIKQEFYEDVMAAIKDINECASLLESGADTQVIDRMFRALHTVKGNCNMVFLTQFVDAIHTLEQLFSDIRSGDIEYDDVYAKFAVTAVNAIKIQLDSLYNTQTADSDVLINLATIIDTIENTDETQRQTVTEKAIIAIEDGHYNLDLVAIDEKHGHAFSFLDATDSEFFQFISDKQATADHSYDQFFCICLTLATKLNAMLASSIDEQQLKTAIIFIGLSKAILAEDNSLDISIEQVFFSSGLLTRMAGWGTAAETVLQLKENHDGSGAPLGLKDEQILPAAQALALAFEFTSLVIFNVSQGYKNALFTAVKTINAKKDIRYKARLIERFNSIIKTDYLTTQMW